MVSIFVYSLFRIISVVRCCSAVFTEIFLSAVRVFSIILFACDHEKLRTILIVMTGYAA